MKRTPDLLLLVALAAALALGSGCVVRVKQNIRDASGYFERAGAEIDRLHHKYASRRGHAHEVCILVHDRDSRELVEVTAPIWLVEFGMDIGLRAARHEADDAFDELERRYDMDWQALKDLDQFGPGLLVEVNDDESRVLIWLR